jgi:hypothetical protein
MMTTTHFSPEKLADHLRLELADAWARVRFPDLSRLQAHAQVTEAVRLGLDQHTAKWVRKNHVQTDFHWMHQSVQPNHLAEAGEPDDGATP